MRALREVGRVWRTCHMHLLHHGDISTWLWSADGEPDEPQAPPLVHRVQWPGPILGLLASAVCPQLSQSPGLKYQIVCVARVRGEGLQLISQSANSIINEELSDKKFNKEMDKGHIQMAHWKNTNDLVTYGKMFSLTKERGNINYIDYICFYCCVTNCHRYSSFQFSSVAQSCPTLCDPMNRSTPGLPVHLNQCKCVILAVFWAHTLTEVSPGWNQGVNRSVFVSVGTRGGSLTLLSQNAGRIWFPVVVGLKSCFYTGCQLRAVPRF